MCSSDLQVEATAENLSMAPMAEWLRPPGADFNGMKLAGTVSGQLRVASDGPATGSGTLTALDWTWGEGNRLEGAQLEATLADGVVKLAPTGLTLDGQPLQVDCDWKLEAPAWECHGVSKGQEIKKLQRWMKALGLRAEWVEELGVGQLRGSLTVSQEGMDAPVWKGQLELRNAELSVPELGVPVKIPAATVVWQQERLAIPALRASAGGLSWTGSYRYEAGAARPHRLLIEAEALEVAELERTLGPLFKGKGFLSRALGMGEKRESGQIGRAHV